MLSGPFCLLLFPGGRPEVFPGGATLTGATSGEDPPDQAQVRQSGRFRDGAGDLSRWRCAYRGYNRERGARIRRWCGNPGGFATAPVIFPGGAALTGATSGEGRPDQVLVRQSGRFRDGAGDIPRWRCAYRGYIGRGGRVRRGSAGFAVLCCCSAPVKRPASGPGTERLPGSGNRQPALHVLQSRHR